MHGVEHRYIVGRKLGRTVEQAVGVDVPSSVRNGTLALGSSSLAPLATLETVKAKYKALVKQHHPDANGGDRSTEDRLIEIIKAYNYLKTVVRES